MTRPTPENAPRPGRPSRLGERLRTDRTAGAALTVGTVAALIWANWPGSHSYTQFWDHRAPWSSPFGVSLSLRDWVNQALMFAFFSVVGFEIRRELQTGVLRSWRRAAVPLGAAVAGMAVPAAIYTALVAGGPGRKGWGIPMATDVAFALGALAFAAPVGRPDAAARRRVFLMTLAVADDILSIVILVAFYSQHVRVGWLLAGLAGVGALFAARRARVHSGWLYALAAALAWWSFLRAGVEAAVVGAVFGACLLTRATLARSRASEVLSDSPRSHEMHLLPWVNAVVLPVFALANTGIRLAGSGLTSSSAVRVFVAVVVARVVGKPVGIALGASASRPLRRGQSLPAQALVGLGALAAIGFTVPLLIVRVALPDGPLQAGATAGLLVGSIVGALLGSAALRVPAFSRRGDGGQRRSGDGAPPPDASAQPPPPGPPDLPNRATAPDRHTRRS
jgi:NhaA family Na+:H+ antiporter